MKEKKYVWQNKKWPNFFLDDSKILPVLSLARRKQGLILAHAAELGLEAQAKILTEDAQATSEIEGEKLEAEPAGFIGGITNKKYVSITKVSPATAKRDLAYLQEKGLIKMNESKGRSASYSLRLKKLDKKRG
jgi:Fic family protein